MTKIHTGKILLSIGIVLALFISGASAAAQYEIDTKNLYQDGNEYFITSGSDLILPVNLSCTVENELISRIEVSAEVKSDESLVTGLTYTYVRKVSADKSGQQVNHPNVFGITGMGEKNAGISSASPVFELNISGLETGNTYNINLTFASGSGTADSVISYAEIEVEVRGYWLTLSEFQDNTHPEYAGADKWSSVQDAEFRDVLLTLPNPAVSGIYNSSLSFPKISGTTVEDYNYTLILNPENTTSIEVQQSADGTEWAAVTAEVKKNTDGTIQIVLTNPAENTQYLQVTYTGRKLGDVVNTDNTLKGDVNFADVDLLLQEIVNGCTGNFVAKDRYIYGDLCKDIEGVQTGQLGILNSNDVLGIYQHWLNKA